MMYYAYVITNFISNVNYLSLTCQGVLKVRYKLHKMTSLG